MSRVIVYEKLRKKLNQALAQMSRALPRNAMHGTSAYAVAYDIIVEIEHDLLLAEDFMECAPCADQTGSPILCKACLHNRALVEALKRSGRKDKEIEGTIPSE